MADDDYLEGKWEFAGATPTIRFFKSDAALATTDRAQKTYTFKRHRLIANDFGPLQGDELGSVRAGEDIGAFTGTYERWAEWWTEFYGTGEDTQRPFVCIQDEIAVDAPYTDFVRQAQTWQSVQASYAFDPTTVEVNS
jgi:hypothetical protein